MRCLTEHDDFEAFVEYTGLDRLGVGKWRMMSDMMTEIEHGLAKTFEDRPVVTRTSIAAEVVQLYSNASPATKPFYDKGEHSKNLAEDNDHINCVVLWMIREQALCEKSRCEKIAQWANELHATSSAHHLSSLAHFGTLQEVWDHAEQRRATPRPLRRTEDRRPTPKPLILAARHRIET
ncbi:Hypothetical protein R9X50_00406600 [Acrodontium crateriforme]|uniref:Uncharacterized protein n=1 Tax=Acrodontium crateriforme TaxID=150365 RepID=A0AAQ3RAF6_9PEZI|nr:Hypothetical protein R9X50_00406600 [Acrodontium crateriforme]